jgi:competence protein ComEC
MQDKIFYSGCSGFVLGVLLRSLFFINLYLVFLLGILAVALLLFFSFISKNNLGAAFCVFVILCVFGMYRFHQADNNLYSGLESKMDQEVNITGFIVDEPDIRENNQKLLLQLPDKTEILISTDFNTTYEYGDEIKVQGVLKKPENFLTDQGKVFDYINYLRKDGVLYVSNYPKLEIISHGNGNRLKSILFNIKNKFLEKIKFVIPDPENLLMGGLILGEKSSFSKELRQDFMNTGTIHIIALSGYNVTIVAVWIMKLFKFLPQTFGISLGIIAILLFIVMTGSSSTSLRAGIMATLALVARATGRNYDVTRALVLALVLMVLLNPLILVYDVSFQLSFLATVAVIFFTPRIEKYFYWLPEKFGLRDTAAVTFAAYVFVSPFILYKMGNLSLVALPANFLILPFIPFTMLLGFITGFVGLFSYLLSVPLGFISFLFLHYELSVVNFFSSLPLSSLSISNFPLVFTILIYAYFIYLVWGGNIKKYFL